MSTINITVYSILNYSAVKVLQYVKLEPVEYIKFISHQVTLILYNHTYCAVMYVNPKIQKYLF